MKDERLEMRDEGFPKPSTINPKPSIWINAPEILAKLDAIEKACKDLRKVVLDSVNPHVSKKPVSK